MVKIHSKIKSILIGYFISVIGLMDIWESLKEMIFHRRPIIGPSHVVGLVDHSCHMAPHGTAVEDPGS